MVKSGGWWLIINKLCLSVNIYIMLMKKEE